MAYEKINWNLIDTFMNPTNLNKMDNKIVDLDENKADKSDTYTKEEIDNILSDWQLLPGLFTYNSNDNINTSIDLRPYLALGNRIAYDQEQALTSLWNLDANSNSQVGSFNGTDTAITYSAGKFNNGAVFNGSTSKIVLADNTALKPTGAFTLGMWFKTNNTGSTKYLFTSFSANSAFAGIILQITNSNKLSFLIGKNSGTTNGVDFMQIEGTTTITDNNQHYVVVTFNNNYLQIYLDGKLEASGYCIAPVYAATNYVRIGCGSLTGTDLNFMNGQIDDVFLINGYALDEQNILKRYNEQTAQSTSNLVITKHALLHAITDTIMNLFHGTDFALVNGIISNVRFSRSQIPYGFNYDESKWSTEFLATSDVNQSNPVQNTWYNFYSLLIKPGKWKVDFSGALGIISAAAKTGVRLQITLATINNGETNTKYSIYKGLSGASASLVDIANFFKSIFLNLNVATTFYLNVRTISATGDITSITTAYTYQPIIIKAVSFYL